MRRPFFLFAGGAYRQGAALLIAALMVGIQAGGNFGHFNLLTIVLCAGSLDGGASAWAPLPPLGPTEGALRLAVGLHTFFSLFFLPFDSWCATGWAHWPEIALARRRGCAPSSAAAAPPPTRVCSTRTASSRPHPIRRCDSRPRSRAHSTA